jgi:hypothetical protein
MVEMIHSWLFAQSKGYFSRPISLVKGKSPQRTKVDPSYQSVYFPNTTSPLNRWVFNFFSNVSKQTSHFWKLRLCVSKDSPNGILSIPSNLLSKPAGFIVLSVFLFSLFDENHVERNRALAHNCCHTAIGG